MANPQAVILLSGGPDSATTFAIAKQRGFDCHALTVNYGQRAEAEVAAAKKISQALGATSHYFIAVDLAQYRSSALTTPEITLPGYNPQGIPVTYVPARNTIFLSLALSQAESLGAHDLFIGAHIIDYSNYPDCHPDYFQAFCKMAALGTKLGQELGEDAYHIHAPLIQLNKSEIFRLATSLGVDLGMTISCYTADEFGRACGHCASCELRRHGFEQAGLADPTVYV